MGNIIYKKIMVWTLNSLPIIREHWSWWFLRLWNILLEKFCMEFQILV